MCGCVSQAVWEASHCWPEGRCAVTATVLVYTRLGAAPSVVTVPEWIGNCLILGADGNYLDDIWVL